MSRRRRGRRNETRSRRIIISRRRSDVSRGRGRRIVIPRRRRGRRDINRAGIGRVKEGTAAEVQGNAEIGGFRLDRNAQRSDRDGADEERSSERASETAFDGSFHRGNPRKVGKRSNDRFERAKWKIDASAATGKRRGRLSLLYAPIFRFDAAKGEKTPIFLKFRRNLFLNVAFRRWRDKKTPPFERKDSDGGASTFNASQVCQGTAAPTIRPGLPAFRLRALRSRPALRLRPLRRRRLPLCRRLALSSGCRTRRRWSSRGA